MRLKKSLLIFLLVGGILVILFALLNTALPAANLSVPNPPFSSLPNKTTSTNAANETTLKTFSGLTKEIRIKETDFVRLMPKAVDPDNDQIKFYFSKPFDEKGGWQTDYNSAGTYEAEIVASDGVDQSIQKVKVTVENKNQPPEITDNKLIFKELETIDLKKYIKDPDNDPLQYVFSPPFDKNGVWNTNYGHEGTSIAFFKVSDSEFTVDFRIEIIIVNTNQPPVITGSFSEKDSITLKENQSLEFWVEAEDSDNDKLNHLWELDGKEIGTDNLGEWTFDFESAGNHQLNLILSDGTQVIERFWEIKVENLNRKPKLALLPINLKEGGKVMLELPEKDSDGDKLTYSFEFPFDQKGEWQTDYQDAGEHLFSFTVSDGEEVVKENLEVTVADLDLAPVISFPPDLGVKEGEKLEWLLPIEDPDNDPLKITFENLPERAKFDEKTKTLLWIPEYSFLKRKGGFVSNVLNSLRLENRLIKKTKIPAAVKACGKDLCSTGTLNLIVYNSNQAPIFSNVPKQISISETETLILSIKAMDPDDDIIRYSYSWPLSRNTGKWTPNYGDSGNYIIYLHANDGKLGTTIPINLTVRNKNRAPVLKVEKESVVVNEGQEFSLKISAADPDETDKLILKLDKIPSGATFNDGLFAWKPDYDTVQNKTQGWWNEFVSGSGSLNRLFSKDQSVVWLNFVANDGTIDSGYPVKVIVKNVNQALKVVNVTPDQETITTYVNQPIIFKFKVQDSDEEKLDYTWSFGWNSQKIKNTDTLKRTFTSTGTKTVKVVVSDGFEELEKEWKVKVVKKPVKAVKDLVQKEISPKIEVKAEETISEETASEQPEEASPQMIIGEVSDATGIGKPAEPVISEKTSTMTISEPGTFVEIVPDAEESGTGETSGTGGPSGYKAKVGVK